MPENTDQKQPKGQFRKGESGNPAGRPKGARNAATLAAEALLDGESETLTRKAIELAFKGDVIALRLCLERIIPPRKSRPVSIHLPSIENASDILGAMSVVTKAVASGELTPDEGQTVATLLEQTRRMHELIDLDGRLTKLEGQTNKP